MSRLDRFKYQRAIPTPGGAGAPAFTIFRLKPLRQLPSFTGTAHSGSGQAAMFGCFVPASSWGLNKLLMLRSIVETTAGPAVSEPGYNMQEFFSITGASSVSPPAYPASTLVAGTYTTLRTIQLLRADPYIFAWDLAQCFQNNALNDPDRAMYCIPIPAISGSFDFGNQIEVSLDALLPPATGSVSAGGIWCEAFLEQATNLGALP